jgi:hypothetical protein
LLLLIGIAIGFDVSVAEELTPVWGLGDRLEVGLEVRVFVSELLEVLVFMLVELYLVYRGV